MIPKSETDHLSGWFWALKPMPYPTMGAAMAGMPEFLAAAYADIQEAYQHVPDAPHLQAVQVDVTNWAAMNDEAGYTGLYWIIRLASIHVLATITNTNGDTLTGYRPILRIEHISRRDMAIRSWPCQSPRLGK